jgi:hypothetical protein
MKVWFDFSFMGDARSPRGIDGKQHAGEITARLSGESTFIIEGFNR